MPITLLGESDLMPLKETQKSLRLYFGFVAACSFYYAVAMVAQGVISPLMAVFSVVNVVFGGLFTYIVLKFPVLLHTKPSLLKRVLAANLVFSVAGFALSLLGGVQLASVISLILAVLIYVYLARSVMRLSNETGQETA